jgi:hypothetical protein
VRGLGACAQARDDWRAQLGKLRGATEGQLDEVAVVMAKMTSMVELNLVTQICRK